MKLASILNEKLIFCGIHGEDRREVYSQLLTLASAEVSNLDVPATLEAILEREDSIGLPYAGAALPHLRIPALDDLHMVIGILDKPVQMKEGDAAPSRIVILSLISENTSDLYLKALSAFVRYLGKPGEKLTAAKTPAAALQVVRDADLTVRKTIVAEDVMTTGVTSVRPQDALTVALDIFTREKRRLLPVLDDNDKLVGVISAREVIRQFIPEYIFMMDSLSFLTSFEPFDRIFRDESTHTVRDFMLKPTLVIPPDMPLIQLTVPLVRDLVLSVFVIDKEHRLLGEISIQNIIEKVLRG